MSVEEDIVVLLTASTSVADVVSDRIRPLYAQQDETFPYIVFDRLNSDFPIHLLGGTTRERNIIGFDCYGKSYSDASAAADALYDQLHGKRGAVNGTAYDVIICDDRATFGIPPTDASDTPTYVTSMNVYAWHAATVPSSL